jgi:TetR/AcrR family transcriptional regulator, cholesterol catabolism regulator
MAAPSIPQARQRSGVLPPAPFNGSRFDRNLARILEHATDVFCERGYEGASMRDLSRASGMSLAGLYHYFPSKERLLYCIQKHTFATIIERARERLDATAAPEERIRIFIQNHVEYFLANRKAMKVLSHEDDVLSGEHGAEIAALKREYYRICVGLVEDYLHSAPRLRRNGRSVKSNRDGARSARVGEPSRIAVLSLFGMVNWIYTWYNPRIDADAGALARSMANIFLHGLGTLEQSTNTNGNGAARQRRLSGTGK